MNLSHLKKMSEDDDFFHVQDMRAGDTFRVAKKGLSPELHGQIAQHFAGGGPVKTFAQALGGMTDEEYAIGKAKEDAEKAAEPQGPGFWEGLKNAYTQNPTGQLASMGPAAAPAQNFTPAPPSVDPGPQPGVNMSSVDGPPGTPPAQPAATPPPQPPSAAVPGTPRPSTGGVGGYERDIQKAGEASAMAEVERAAIERAKADEMVKAQADFQLKKEATSKLWDDRYNQTVARGNQLAQDMADSRIDPNGFWNSRNTAQKVGASIALVLGGIGQAFGGGPNQALAVIKDHMEKDIDAQKANLGKKQSLLSHYVQEGHSIQDAKKLALADMMDAYRGQTEMMLTKYGGQEAGPAAMKTIAGIAKDTASLRSEIHQKGAQMDISRQELELKRQELGIKALTGKSMQEQDAGKMAALKDAPEILKNINEAQADVGPSGIIGAVTPEWAHFGAQRHLDNVINAGKGPLSIAAYPLAKSETPELMHSVAELLPKGYQSKEAAQAKTGEFLKNVQRASATKLDALRAGGVSAAEINALRIPEQADQKKLLLQWASQNRGDPKAEEALQLLGMR